MGDLYNKTMDEMENKRQRILSGSVNCIPSPFKRFTNDFCGVEQDTMYCITSFTKGGKSQFCSYTFIYQTIVYSYFAKEKLDFKIIYFPLEETKERIMQRFMSWLLFKFSKGKVRISPKDLRSTTKALDEKILDRLREFDVQDLLNYFEEHIIFPTEAPNPTGIYKYCKQYAEDHGTVKKKTVKMKDELGEMQDVEVFDSYEQDNPDEYRMIIIDTVNLIDTERGMNLKQSIDKLSEYCAKYLRNRYHFSPILIQQQAFESEGNEAFKMGRVRPSVAGLGDSKYVSRDADIVLGLFSPFRFGMTDYLGYDITILKDRLRFLEVIVNRNGEMGGILPLWFDGAVCDFRELPKSDDKNALAQVYSDCKYLEATGKYPSSSSPSKATSLLLSTKNAVKHFINYKI
jgi:replicative DNA helicase